MPCEYKSVPLALVLMGDDDTLSADEHFEFLKFVLSIYERSMDSVVALVSETEDANCAFSRRVGPTLVGFHGQCFNFALQNILCNWDSSLSQLHDLMQRLSHHICAAKFW